MISKHTFLFAVHLLCTALLLNILNWILPNFTLCIYSCISMCILWICIAVCTFTFTKRKFLSERIQPKNRAIFVTGCDSGFGHQIAKRFDCRGYHVFATCLFPSEKGASELKKSCSKRLHILHLDITQEESVKKAVDYVNDNLGTSNLWAVVNNAGIHKGISTDTSDIQDFKDCLDVNTLGPVRVVKAFLPLLKQSKGRIVNITSLAGVISLPFLAPYATSKFAITGFTECLRQELDMWGISVIAIEPEMFKTGLAEPAAVHMKLNSAIGALDTSVKEDYGEKYFKSLKKSCDFLIHFASPELNVVVDDVESAVTLVYPEYTYKPRRNGFVRLILFCFEQLPKSFQFLIATSFLNIIQPKANKMY